MALFGPEVKLRNTSLILGFLLQACISGGKNSWCLTGPRCYSPRERLNGQIVWTVLPFKLTARIGEALLVLLLGLWLQNVRWQFKSL